MAKVDRTVVHDGEYCLVEYAIKADGSEPAKQFLEQLATGMVEIQDIPNPDEKQPGFRAKLLATIFDFADGEEIPKQGYNFLTNGIWEFKAGDVRISFYDTDGAGAFQPKNWHRTGPYAQPDLPEEFDEYVRLGHSFAKSDRRTENHDLGECEAVRKEDVKHDRA